MIALVQILKNKHLPFLFAVSLFLCVLCYSGIIVDAVLYVTQYVYSVDPSRFLGDPAFEFGNQNSLGFFSPIFGFFLEIFGVANGAFAYTFLMQIAWIVGIVCLIKSLFRLTWQRLWVLPTVILYVFFFGNGASFFQIQFFKYISL